VTAAQTCRGTTAGLPEGAHRLNGSWQLLEQPLQLPLQTSSSYSSANTAVNEHEEQLLKLNMLHSALYPVEQLRSRKAAKNLERTGLYRFFTCQLQTNSVHRGQTKILDIENFSDCREDSVQIGHEGEGEDLFLLNFI